GRPGRGAQLHRVAFAGLEQGAGDGRDPADLAVFQVGFVDADDGHRLFRAVFVGIGDGRAEEDLRAVLLLRRVDDLSAFQALGEEADAPVDLAQPFLAVDVVAVLGTVAVARRPRHGLHHLRPLDLDQGPQLVLQAAVAGWRHVVFDAGRDRRAV